MYTLTLMLSGQVNPFILQYEKADKAEAHFAAVQAGIEGRGEVVLSLRDGFNRAFVCNTARIEAVMFEDIPRSRAGDVLVQLDNARAQATLQKTAASDPLIRGAQISSAMMGAGGSLIRN